VLRDTYERGQRWIVYCESSAQLRAVLSTLRRSGLSATEYHTAMAGDRIETLRDFEMTGGIIVSIRCLDEGVDIPSVSHALILASSKNPREFIQRRGRVLRRAPHKALAVIHDAIVMPIDSRDRESPPTIIEGELARAIEFGLWADNPAAISDLQAIAIRCGLDPATVAQVGMEGDDDDATE
jgi:hypothetical protein